MSFRQVDIRIEGDYPRDLPNWVTAVSPIPVIIANWGKNRDGIKALLESQNWVINQIGDESGWTGNYIYRITATVGEHYTDRQIQDQVVRDLAGYFTVIGASILSAAYSVPQQYVWQGQQQQPPANYNQVPNATEPGGNNFPSIGNFDGGTVYGNTGGDFFSNLGLGAGITTPIALLAAAVLLVVIVKK